MKAYPFGFIFSHGFCFISEIGGQRGMGVFKAVW